MFGRRKSPPPPPPPQQPQGEEPGHAAVLAHLDREEAQNPLQRAQLTGRILFELVCQIVADEKGVRIENLLAVLASVGGQQCIAPLLEKLEEDGRTPQDVGMIVADATDGHRYYFGDLPNRFLIESQTSLLSLALGAAQSIGATVSMEMVTKEMGKVAELVGHGDDFFALDLPDRNGTDSPLNWAAVFGEKLVEACEKYRMPPLERHIAIGFAIQRALDAAREGIDPDVATRLVLQAAVRMAKVDPARVARKRAEMGL